MSTGLSQNDISLTPFQSFIIDEMIKRCLSANVPKTKEEIKNFFSSINKDTKDMMYAAYYMNAVSHDKECINCLSDKALSLIKEEVLLLNKDLNEAINKYGRDLKKDWDKLGEREKNEKYSGSINIFMGYKKEVNFALTIAMTRFLSRYEDFINWTLKNIDINF